MIAFTPAYARTRLGQAPAPAPAAEPAPAPVAPAPMAPPVVASTSYTGLPGFLETVAVLGVVSAAAWTGVRQGMKKDNKQVERIAGWVGGVGSAILGLLYLGSKTGVTRTIALPQVQVSPA